MRPVESFVEDDPFIADDSPPDTNNQNRADEIQQQLPAWARTPAKKQTFSDDKNTVESPRFYDNVNDNEDSLDDEEPVIHKPSNSPSKPAVQADGEKPKIQLDTEYDIDSDNNNDNFTNNSDFENDFIDDNSLELSKSAKEMSSSFNLDEMKKSVLFNSKKEDIYNAIDEDATDEIKEHAEKMARLHDVAMTLKEALDIQDKHDSQEEEKEPQEEENYAKILSKNQIFYINDKQVNLPVASSKESIQYRIEAMRSYLENQIGVNKLMELNKELINKAKDDSTPTPVISDLPPGLVCLAEQLLIIDSNR